MKQSSQDGFHVRIQVVRAFVLVVSSYLLPQQKRSNLRGERGLRFVCSY